MTEARQVILQDLTIWMRAPVAGRIIDPQVMGLRSVIVAASLGMIIVPRDEPLPARVRIAARDVDQVSTGQEDTLHFTAFNGRDVPIILGRVVQVAADAFVDPRRQGSRDEVAISLGAVAEVGPGGGPLLPGMPVGPFHATQSRTPPDHVLRPIRVCFDRAFRDA